jgi:hypothetical protein
METLKRLSPSCYKGTRHGASLAKSCLIAPHRERLPHDTVHWQRMGEAVDTARPAVSAVLTLMNEIDKDPDLNPQGESVKSAAATNTYTGKGGSKRH